MNKFLLILLFVCAYTNSSANTYERVYREMTVKEKKTYKNCNNTVINVKNGWSYYKIIVCYGKYYIIPTGGMDDG